MPAKPKATAVERAWQRMLSGRRLNILDPSPLDIEIEDVALGLSRVARWNGQTAGAHGFSVAQHSLLTLDLMMETPPACPPELRLACLLHDASEFVTSDLITPFKAAIGPRYKMVEGLVERAVQLRFGLPAQLPTEWTGRIKAADRAAAALEAVRLAGYSPEEARSVLGWKGKLSDRPLVAWPPEQARLAFLERFAAEWAAAERARAGRARRAAEE